MMTLGKRHCSPRGHGGTVTDTCVEIGFRTPARPFVGDPTDFPWLPVHSVLKPAWHSDCEPNTQDSTKLPRMATRRVQNRQNRAHDVHVGSAHSAGSLRLEEALQVQAETTSVLGSSNY